MRSIGWRAACCVWAVVFCAQAQAETPSSRERERMFGVTPFAALRFGGEFDLDEPSRDVGLDSSEAFALALNWRIDETNQYELFYSRQSSDLEDGTPVGNTGVDVEYLHLGGIAELETGKRLIPYIAGGLGATRISPKPENAGDETRFSISIGAGVRVPFSERLSLRFEGRGYVTLMESDSSLFCRADEQGSLCLVHASGSTFIQYELLAGAAFAF